MPCGGFSHTRSPMLSHAAWLEKNPEVAVAPFDQTAKQPKQASAWQTPAGRTRHRLLNLSYFLPWLFLGGRWHPRSCHPDQRHINISCSFWGIALFEYKTLSL